MALAVAVFGSLALGLQPAQVLRSSATSAGAAARLGIPVMVAVTSRVTPTPERARSFGRKRDAAVSDEAMRWYLTSIGTRQLLDNEEEVRLALAVKELLRCVLFTLKACGRIRLLSFHAAMLWPRLPVLACGGLPSLGCHHQPAPRHLCSAVVGACGLRVSSHTRPP